MATDQLRLFEGAGPRQPNALTKDERDALVLSCEKLCYQLAGKAAATLPGADADNLAGEALLACVEAARYWQPGGAAKFATFAQAYIAKRLAGMVADERPAAAGLRGANWDIVPDEHEDGDGESAEAVTDAYDRELLAALAEPARTAVALVVFDRLSPERVAERLGMAVKDVKLHLRNAAAVLKKAKAKLDAADLFDGGDTAA